MNENLDRNWLRETCDLFGGIRAISRKAGVGPSNLSTWLKGQPTLSDEKVGRLLSAMGLPDSHPTTDNIHVWQLKEVKCDYSLAFKPYFPNGALIARAPWAKPGIENIRRTFQIGKTPPSVYLLTDGNVKGVLRLSPGLLVQKNNLKNFIRWKEGDRDSSVLNISEDDSLWIMGHPTIEEFDALWHDTPPPATRDDVISAILDENITFEEAIHRIRRKSAD